MSIPAGLKAIDWSQYASWPSFVGSDGHTYYIPPNGQGYAYDPFLHHLFQDGRQAKADAQKATDDQQKAIKDANSPVRQFGSIAGVAGLTAGIPILANNYFPSALQQAQTALIQSKIPQQVAQQVTQQVTPSVAQQVMPNVASAAQAAAQSTAQAAVDPALAGVMQNGSLDLITPESQAAYGGNAAASAAPVAEDPGFFSTSNLTAAPGTLGSIISGAAAAKGAYDAINGFQHGGKGLRPGLTELGAGIGGFGGPLGSVVGAGLGNLAGYGLQGNGWKNHAALLANPITWPLEAAKLAGVNLIHETTRQYQQKNTQDLLAQSNDPTWQGYVSAMRGQNETGPSDASMPYGDTKGNKYANFDEYKKAGLDAANLTGVVGNLQTFGPDWAKITEQQRQAVTQGIIDAGLYSSHKGEVVIDDPTKAKDIYASVVGGAQPILSNTHLVPVTNTQAAAQAAAPITVVNQPPPRTSTLSPGINLKGQRIVY